MTDGPSAGVAAQGTSPTERDKVLNEYAREDHLGAGCTACDWKVEAVRDDAREVAPPVRGAALAHAVATGHRVRLVRVVVVTFNPEPSDTKEQR